MFKAIRNLKAPAAESHVGMALALAAVFLSVMLWGVIWQANIIVYQRALIRSLSMGHFGG